YISRSKSKAILIALSFFAIYFIWGTTYLANIFGLKGMKPFVLSTLRYGMAAILLTVGCFIKKLPFPGWKNSKVYIISGLLMLVGGSGLVVLGEQYINSGHAAVVIATEPLLFLLFDKKSRRSFLNDKWITGGLLLGFSGILVFSHFSSQDQAHLTHPGDVLKGTILVLTSTLFWVAGTLYARNYKTEEDSHIAGAAVKHIAAAVACFVIAIFSGEWSSFTPGNVSANAWGGLAFLVVMGSLIAFMAFTWLVTVKPAAIVSTHTYVNPLVAVLIGWIMAKEQVGTMQILALTMVLAGVALTNIKAKDHAVQVGSTSSGAGRGTRSLL
ncbi:MAG TPA: EamA family transporter, partial [Puia sp.]|nr:EamA family transporter [Puia sp.]